MCVLTIMLARQIFYGFQKKTAAALLNAGSQFKMDENIYEDTTRCNSDKDPESNSDNDSKSEIDYGDVNTIEIII